MIKDHLDQVLNELQRIPDAVDPEQLDQLAAALAAADTIAGAGAGRSRLALQMFVMRLRHIGLNAFAAGETSAPALQEGDLLLAASGSGKTSTTLAIARRAKEVNARVWALTGSAESTLAELADGIVVLPSREQGYSTQFGGTLFEAGILAVGDALILELLERTGQDHTHMAARHTNLE